jgi:hypothetical protein
VPSPVQVVAIREIEIISTRQACTGRRYQETVAVMDLNDHVVEIIVRERLAEMRAAAESSHLVRPSRPVAHRLRVALGLALIRAGRRLKGVRRPGGTLATRRRAVSGAVRG